MDMVGFAFQQSEIINTRPLRSGKNMAIDVMSAGLKEDADQVKFFMEFLNNSPKDVSGAGDSLLIVSAMTLACAGTIWEAACLGSLAAAIQVSRVGNTPLEKEELIRELN
jgi:bifunctional ADP-heptose synthase (sugar kinase/adenylyltransferase)